MEIADRFAENLMRQRRARSFSQEDLADRAAVHRTQISLMEGGKRLPRLDTLIKIAAALEVPIPRLVEGIHWTPPVTKGGEFDISDPAD